MRNIFLFAAWLLFMPVILHAQLKKNNILLEGSFAYSRSSPEYSAVAQPAGYPALLPLDVVSQDLLLSPLAGIFLTDHIVLSCGIVYSRSSHKEDGAITSFSPSYGYGTTYTRINNLAISNDIAPVLSLRYFLPVSDKLYFSPQLGAAYHFTRSKIENSYLQESHHQDNNADPVLSPIQGNEFKANYPASHLAFHLAPQLVYFVRPWLGLEAQLGGFSFITAHKDSRYPPDRQPGSSLDLSLAPSAWKFGLLVNLGSDRN